MKRFCHSNSRPGRSLVSAAALCAMALAQSAFAAAMLEDVRFADPASATKAAPRAPRSWRIPKVAAAPRIDGKLTDACWRTPAARLGSFSIGLSSVPARHSREAWAVYDDRALYFGVKLQREPGKPLRALTHDADNGQIWKDDEVELFFDPFATGREYFQLILNSEGVLYDARHRIRVVLDPRGAGPGDTKHARETDLEWASHLERAVSIEAGYWSIEMRLPLKSIGLAAAPAGHEVRFNITSADWDTEEYTCLTPVSSWHDPNQFGALILGDKRLEVEELRLAGVGAGENEMTISLRDLSGRAGQYTVALAFSTPGSQTQAQARLALEPNGRGSATVSFAAPSAVEQWDADIRVLDAAGATVVATRRTGKVPPALMLRLDSRAAFSDGLPVGLAARIGFGAQTRGKLTLRASLLDSANRVVKQQSIPRPSGALLTAKLPVEGLPAGRYRVRVEALQNGKPLAQVEDALLVGRSPFMRTARP